jgi:hypothetical protein
MGKAFRITGAENFKFVRQGDFYFIDSGHLMGDPSYFSMANTEKLF